DDQQEGDRDEGNPLDGAPGPGRRWSRRRRGERGHRGRGDLRAGERYRDRGAARAAFRRFPADAVRYRVPLPAAGAVAIQWHGSATSGVKRPRRNPGRLSGLLVSPHAWAHCHVRDAYPRPSVAVGFARRVLTAARRRTVIRWWGFDLAGGRWVPGLPVAVST